MDADFAWKGRAHENFSPSFPHTELPGPGWGRAPPKHSSEGNFTTAEVIRQE